MEMKSESTQEKHVEQTGIEIGFLIQATIVYLFMFLCGFTSMRYASHNTELLWPTSLHLGKKEILTPLYQIALLVGLLSGLQFILQEFLPSFNRSRQFMVTLFGRLPTTHLIHLSLFAAVGEEVLFRGAIQPLAGLLLTSLLFGILHIGPGGEVFSGMTLWAFIAALFLGGLVVSSQMLWPAILAHFILNVISMIRLKRDFIKNSPEEKQNSPNDFFS